MADAQIKTDEARNWLKTWRIVDAECSIKGAMAEDPPHFNSLTGFAPSIPLPPSVHLDHDEFLRFLTEGFLEVCDVYESVFNAT